MVESKILPAIAAVFTQANVNRLPTRDLLAALNADNDSRALANGQLITEKWLARQLRPFGIQPRSLWFAGSSRKGYLRSQFPIS